MSRVDPLGMKAWIRPGAWAAVALAAVWLRALVDHDNVHGGLTVIALVSAIAATISILELAGGRQSKRE